MHILRGDQDVDVFEEPLEALLELSEEPFSFPISAGDDFYLDDIVNKIDAALGYLSIRRSQKSEWETWDNTNPSEKGYRRSFWITALATESISVSTVQH